MLTGASAAYGLTEGAAQSSAITLTDLGRRCVAPTEEGDDLVARREAVLKPRVIREFLQRYDGNALPQKTIALNVIETLNVPGDVAERANEMIVDNAEALGLFLEIKGKKYIKLDAEPSTADRSVDAESAADESKTPLEALDETYEVDDAPDLHTKPPTDPTKNNRVFITHGKNATVVEQIKKILTYGKFEPVVSAQRQTVAKPLPEKVMDDMRACSAAIVHVGIERVLLDEKGDEHPQINGNVLIEIGAAMALYDRRFVLLVERGVQLPSNLQGLYEVRYEGEQLEFDATMKLLEVFSSF
jgi:predicted nucleotide-binding protein